MPGRRRPKRPWRTNRIEAAAALADTDTEPGEDQSASRDYRRHLTRMLTKLGVGAGRGQLARRRG